MELLPLRGRLRPRTARRLARHLEASATRLVQAHTRPVSATATAAALLAGIPAIATFHTTGEIDTWRRRLSERLYAPFRAAIVCVSEAVRGHYLALTGVPPRKVVVLPNGVDVRAIASTPRERLPVRREFALPEDALLVVCPARLVPQKNHTLLIEAFARVAGRHPRAHLLLVGDGPLRSALRDQARRAGVASRIIFAGIRNDVPRLLRAADVAAITSRIEGFGIALVEAMAAGLPCVVTAVGGMPEVIGEPGAAGELVPPDDPAACADALDRLLANPERRRRLGDAAARRACRFDLDRVAAQTEELYDRILRDRRWFRRR